MDKFKKYIEVFSSMTAPMTVLDLYGNLILANKAFSDLLGYGEDKFIGQKAPLFYWAKEDLHNIQRAFVGTIKKGITGKLWEVVFVKNDGSRIELSMLVSKLKGPSAEIIGYAAVFDDITERKNLERNIKKSEEKYRRLFESSGDAIFLADTETGNIIDANKKAEELFGIPYKEFIGMNQTQLHPADEFFRYKRLFEKAVQRKKLVLTKEELYVVKKDGTKIPVTISASLIEIGEKQYLQGVFRDNSARKELEDAMSKIRENLEIRVQKRTAELSRMNLELQEEIAERKKAEENLLEKDKLIDFMLGATKTGLDIIDSEFNIRYIDSGWKKHYGEPAGKKCYEYFMGRHTECPQCGVRKALQTKSVVVTERTLPREGSRNIQITSIPFQYKNGEWAVAEVNSDISVLKKYKML